MSIEINVYLLFMLLIVALVIGYWARKYLEKKYPDRVVALDTVVNEFGDKAEEVVRDWRNQRGGRNE